MSYVHFSPIDRIQLITQANRLVPFLRRTLCRRSSSIQVILNVEVIAYLFYRFRFQNANVNEDADEDDTKADVNWYSSDEEEPEPSQETEPNSLLSSLLRTLQTTTSNVPSTEPQADEVPTLTNPFSAPSISAAESDPLPVRIYIVQFQYTRATERTRDGYLLKIVLFK